MARSGYHRGRHQITAKLRRANELLAEHSLARGAELALLRLQARRDLVGVGDELAAQTEDIRSAGAARFFRALVFASGEARGGRKSESDGDDCDLQHCMFLFAFEEIISSFIMGSLSRKEGS